MFTQTLTFCECAENHVGMEKIGQKSATGYSMNDLKHFESKFKSLGSKTELISLSNYAEEAGILIIRDGVNILASDMAKNILEEHLGLKDLWDKKALMGRGEAAIVKNKNARHNLCFADKDQEPDYANGKGRIINFSDFKIPYTLTLRNFLNDILDEKDLLCEANYYYDVRKTYIGFHGDTERSKVIGVRFGASMPLYFQWFYQNQTIGHLCYVILNHGDIYIMSSKAVGNDWKRSSIHTLRHAAGLEATLRKTPGPNRFFEGIRSEDIKHLC